MATTEARLACIWDALRVMPISPRVQRLHHRFQQRYAELGSRKFNEVADARVRDEAILTAYRDTVGQPAITRRARVLSVYAESARTTVHPDDLFVGRQTFLLPVGADEATRGEIGRLGYAHTTGHIVHDYGRLVERGIAGCLDDIRKRRAAAAEPADATVLDAFEEAMRAFARFVGRHAQEADFGDLVGEPPRRFRQALQLVWLAQVFLHVENPSAAISFGRIDQYLWPSLERDLADGTLSLDDAFELVCAFCIKCCEGEESQNAVLGGVDADANDASNPVSLLFLRAVQALHTFQPSLSVRIHPAADPAFVGAACALAAEGTGQPGFMNDPVVIESLGAVGIAPERAWDWAIVGCYEATLQGAAYPNTVLGGLSLAEVMADYLAGERAKAAATFDQFLEGWLEQLRERYARELAGCQARWNAMRAAAPSPFGSVLMRGCVERATPLEAGGADVNLVGIDILGLGTLVDSLHAIRTLVYERGDLSLAEIAQAVAADFPDEALRRRLLTLPGRYGTDAEPTNALAADLSARIARMVLDSRLDGGVRPYPGLFRFLADIYTRSHASPDGRRKDDLLSYGVGPSSSTDTTPTALMASASHVAHRLCGCGNPLALSLPRADARGQAGIALLRSLVTTYFQRGGFHVHFNVVSADELREAKAHPERHAALTIRVSGYSARFVTLDEMLQDALIERAGKGL